METTYQYLLLSQADTVTTVTLNRPELHNAFHPDLIAELRTCFSALATASQTRVIVLTGNGLSFCAGADLNWMQSSLGYSYEENLADALLLADMYATINGCPKPVIGKINGAAIGGGVGLVAVCDIAIAVEQARFQLSEVKLGIAPAVISPYVIAKIGPSFARALSISGERLSATRAATIGLLHEVVAKDDLEGAVARQIKMVLGSAPEATAACKEVVAFVSGCSDQATVRQYTAETIANLRTGAEGQEGIRAFLEKRTPNWVHSDV